MNKILRASLEIGVVACIIASGCSKAQNAPIASSSSGTCGNGTLPSSCCPDGTDVDTSIAGCNSSAYGGGATSAALTNGAGAASAILGNSGNAGTLAANNGGLTSPFAQTAAATAGGTILTSATPPPANTAAATAPGSAAAAGGMGGGPAGGGGGGGGSLFGDLSMQASGASNDQQGSGPEQVNPDVAGSAYGAGGNGGGNRGGNSAGTDDASAIAGLFGGGNKGASGTSKELGFGADRSPADAMGSEDPADYFTRIGLNDSLFKRVESRYREKQVAWASESSSGRVPQTATMSAASIPK